MLGVKRIIPVANVVLVGVKDSLENWLKHCRWLLLSEMSFLNDFVEQFSTSADPNQVLLD